MIEIPLNKGFVALIDDEDYDKVKNYHWYAKKHRNTYYAAASPNHKWTVMHRIILGVNDPKILIDHEDHNGLNNQKNNIRICTTTENCRNKTGWGTSKYLGVSKQITTQKYLQKRTGKLSIYKGKPKWRAQIMFNGKVKCIGQFKNEIDAAKAYDKVAKEHFGKFANLNFKEKII